ncbi:MAG: thiamine pyrophosphate-dependent enzyme [Promethearchaeota archaeon]
MTDNLGYKEIQFTEEHPLDRGLRVDRLPHIWCQGCGAGNVVAAYLTALGNLGLDHQYEAVVSGIGCTGRVAGYLNIDSFHTTHGRAIPFAIGLKLANPKLNVTVISGDGDLFAIGGNHIIHAARRNLNLLVICVNNYIYGMTGGQLAPTTPLDKRSTTSPYGNVEHPFNLSFMAAASGASYVARWNSVDVRRLTRGIMEAMGKKGFRFIEVISPCPTSYGRMNRLGDEVAMAQDIIDRAEIKHGIDPALTDIEEGKPIIYGKFKDIEKETFQEALANLYERLRG